MKFIFKVEFNSLLTNSLYLLLICSCNIHIGDKRYLKKNNDKIKDFSEKLVLTKKCYKQCINCKSVFKKKKDFLKHIIEQIKCPIDLCEKYINRLNITTHIKAKHKNLNICKKCFASIDNNQSNHTKNHSFKCFEKNCFESFDKKKSLSAHLINKHYNLYKQKKLHGDYFKEYIMIFNNNLHLEFMKEIKITYDEFKSISKLKSICYLRNGELYKKKKNSPLVDNLPISISKKRKFYQDNLKQPLLKKRKIDNNNIDKNNSKNENKPKIKKIKIFECTICKNIYKSKNLLKKHLYPQVFCPICKKKIKLLDITTHLKRIHKDKVCNCCFILKTDKNKLEHEDKHFFHCLEKKCNGQNLKFEKKGRLSLHLINAHSNENLDGNYLNEYFLDIDRIRLIYKFIDIKFLSKSDFLNLVKQNSDSDHYKLPSFKSSLKSNKNTGHSFDIESNTKEDKNHDCCNFNENSLVFEKSFELYRNNESSIPPNIKFGNLFPPLNADIYSDTSSYFDNGLHTVFDNSFDLDYNTNDELMNYDLKLSSQTSNDFSNYNLNTDSIWSQTNQESLYDINYFQSEIINNTPKFISVKDIFPDD